MLHFMNITSAIHKPSSVLWQSTGVAQGSLGISAEPKSGLWKMLGKWQNERGKCQQSYEMQTSLSSIEENAHGEKNGNSHLGTVRQRYTPVGGPPSSGLAEGHSRPATTEQPVSTPLGILRHREEQHASLSWLSLSTSINPSKIKNNILQSLRGNTMLKCIRQ